MARKFLLIFFILILFSSFTYANTEVFYNFNYNSDDQFNYSINLTNVKSVSYSDNYPIFQVSGDGSNASADFSANNVYFRTTNPFFTDFEKNYTFMFYLNYTESIANNRIFLSCFNGGTDFNRMLVRDKDIWWTSDHSGVSTINNLRVLTNFNDGLWHSVIFKYNAVTRNASIIVDNGLGFASQIAGATGQGALATECVVGESRNKDGSSDYDNDLDNLIFKPRLTTNQEDLNYYNYGNTEIPVFDTLNITSINPENKSQFNQTKINFNASIEHSYNYNCSLYVNGSIVYNWTNQSSNSINVSLILNPGENNYSFYCNDNQINETSPTNIFYVDIVFPSIQTDFQNDSVWFRDNLTAYFNFTDDFYLNSFNITIDGVEVASNDNLSGTSFEYNLSTNISNLSVGYHILSVKLADGHTANKIKPYKVKTGLFGDKLEYEWDDQTGRSKKVSINHIGGSIFDTFTTEKKEDRYTWEFIPSDKNKKKYEFDIETDQDIRIINDDSTYLKSWITFGDKWMDFDLKNEDEVIEIQRISKNKVKVKISNIKNPEKQIYQSIGDLNIIEANYSFYKINASVVYQTTVFEGSYTPYFLNIYADNVIYKNNSASLFWYNETKSNVKINISDHHQRYNTTFLVPMLNVSTVNWTYFFNVSGYPFNISGSSEYVQMNITNCSANDYVVLNYTIYDEETFVEPSGENETIETYLTLTTPGLTIPAYEFSVKEEDSNLLICLPNSTLNQSSFILDALTKYYYEDHVEEFHYIENFTLTSSNIPQVISLYDLASADATSFIVTYQNERYLYVQGVVIDLLRQYIADDGEFVSVEHAKTDEGGQTRLHFVTEDVIYKAHVWYNGVLQYTTDEFQALCQATPCQINLRKPYDESDQVSEYQNIVYDISTQEEFYNAQSITFDFSTVDGTSATMNMNVTLTTSVFNDTLCSDTKTLSAGSLVCVIPAAYYNSTYTARIYKDGEFIGWRTYSLEPDANDIFGRTGVFLGAMGYLMLAMMGISSAPVSIVLGIVGLILMGLMNVFMGGAAFGIGSSFIWIIIAGGILVYKYQQRRVQ